jgi:hypothetical protein
MSKDEALKLALDELENCADLLKMFNAPIDSCVGSTMLQAEEAITAIKQALEQPVAYRQTGWAAHRDQYAVPVLFNPYTGEPRDVRDVQSDPQGILIVPPGRVEMLAAKPTHQQSLQVATPPAVNPTTEKSSAVQPAPVQPVGEVIGTNEYAGFWQIKHVKTIQWRGEPAPIGTKLYTTPPAQEIVCSTGLCHYKPAAAVQPLPCGVGGGLVAIKTLLSRDPCVHANIAIEMLDAILKEHPAAQRPWVGLTDEERTKIRREHYARTLPLMDAVEAKLKELNT